MALKGLGCPCSNVPGVAIGQLNRQRRNGFGAWPKSVGFGSLGLTIATIAKAAAPVAAAAKVATPVAAPAPAPVAATVSTGTSKIAVSTAAVAPISNQNPAYASAPTVTVSGSAYTAVTQAIAQVQSGTNPSAAQAVAFIPIVTPQVPAKTTVPVPSGGGTEGAKTTSNLSGLGTLRGNGSSLRSPMYRTKGFGAVAVSTSAGVNPNASTASAVVVDTATGAALGTAIMPGIGTAIGAAVGAIVGLISGLFGKKQAVPTVSAADIAQAKTWYAQYNAIANSTVGRQFTQTAIQDMITAAAILDPGFWGDSSSTQISIPAVNNFYGEVMTRVSDFMTAIQAAAVGATITIKDDPSIAGHGKTNLNVTYSFISPGLNAPSYVLGPLFAQYFYTMCAIFVPASDCTGHLNPPLPQFYTDLIDYVRSTHAGWDTPQPNVVGIVPSVAAPTETVNTTGEAVGASSETTAVIPVTLPPAVAAQAASNPKTTAPVIVAPAVVAITPPKPVVPAAAAPGSITPVSVASAASSICNPKLVTAATPAPVAQAVVNPASSIIAILSPAAILSSSAGTPAVSQPKVGCSPIVVQSPAIVNGQPISLTSTGTPQGTTGSVLTVCLVSPTTAAAGEAAAAAATSAAAANSGAVTAGTMSPGAAYPSACLPLLASTPIATTPLTTLSSTSSTELILIAGAALILLALSRS